MLKRGTRELQIQLCMLKQTVYIYCARLLCARFELNFLIIMFSLSLAVAGTLNVVNIKDVYLLKEILTNLKNALVIIKCRSV